MNFFEFSKLCMRPPGEGVFTVSNAKARKESLHDLLYQSKENIPLQWQESLVKNLNDGFSGVAVLGICSDTGGGIQRGANWGPLFLRESMLSQFEWSVTDLGDILVVPQVLHDKYLNIETIKQIRKSIYKDENIDLPVSPLSLTELAYNKFLNNFPQAKVFGIGGDHSVSYPLVKAWAENKAKLKKKIGLIHFDAHTDLMIERLGIDLCFGSWVPPIIPLFQDPSDIYQIGIRSSGQVRSHWENKFGVHQLWADEIKHNGLEKSLSSFEQYLKKKQFDEVYISFDIDALDSQYAGATGTPEIGGLAPHEAILFLDLVGQYTNITGSDMMEIAPFVQIDNDQMAQQTTLKSASYITKVLTDLMSKS
ncbi:MAG: arginase [Bdellovibrionales bacterium CG12_big_fil_rev_8_21_14_0_65_38_15]|nr:MAG: arginase [Bdellovibrionales bacterium CG22_combo_CG10-13_8_21_14_all_38_13]PIQ54080.1 MAG: arginase [Bdellovibrionales bacterium CG12_big_fil_rev_8_21_14_0_65_38_15]PIR28605.1 MAG: arginase [Bdellovibrionales bacterium CG11_big_fil_rev_8_21_14_0_20_38_13]